MSTPPVARKLTFDTPSVHKKQESIMVQKDNEPEFGGFWAGVALRVVIAVREVWHWLRTVTARVRGLGPPEPDAGLIELKQMLKARQPVDIVREKNKFPEVWVFDRLHEHKDWFVNAVKKHQRFDTEQPFSLLLHVLKPLPEKGFFRGMTLSVRDRVWGPEVKRPCVDGQWRKQFLSELREKTGIEQNTLEQLFWVQQDFDQLSFRRLVKDEQGLIKALGEKLFNVVPKDVYEQNPFITLVYLTQVEAQQFFNRLSSS